MPGLFDHIKLSEFFDVNNKDNAEIFKNGGMSNFFSEDAMKKMFIIYLLGKKDMTLSDILDNEKEQTVDKVKLTRVVDSDILKSAEIYTDAKGIVNLSKEEKKALGDAFIADIKKRQIYGEVKGGAKAVKDNLAWYGEMFSKAMDRLAEEPVNIPSLEAFSSVENVCMYEGEPFMAVSEIADDFIMQTGASYTRRSNRPTKRNNYGIDMGKAFIKGYGGIDKYDRDVNRMKTVSIIGGYAGKVHEAAASGNTASAVASLAAGALACKYREDTIEEKIGNDEDELNKLSAADSDKLLSEKMETASKLVYINYQVILDKKYEDKKYVKDKKYTEYEKNTQNKKADIHKFDPFLRGEELGKKESTLNDNIFDMAISNTAIHVRETNNKTVKNVIGTINMNNNSDIYEYFDDENNEIYLGDNVLTLSLLFNGLDSAAVHNESIVFDDIFAPLIEAEKKYENISDVKDIFRRFKINGKSVRAIYESNLNKLNGYDVSPELVCKHLVLNAMTQKEYKLTYSPYTLDANDWNKAVISKEKIEIKIPANISKMSYTSIKGLRRDLEGMIEGYEELKLIDSMFHINRKLFTNVKDSLEVLKEMTEDLYKKKESSDSPLSNEDRRRFVEQFDIISHEMETYINAREGAISKLGKKRLNKIKSLYGNLKIIKSNLVGLTEAIYGEADVPDNEIDDVVRYDWDMINQASSYDDYVDEMEYNDEMKVIYTKVMGPDEEYQAKKAAQNEVKNKKKAENKPVEAGNKKADNNAGGTGRNKAANNVKPNADADKNNAKPNAGADNNAANIKAQMLKKLKAAKHKPKF